MDETDVKYFNFLVRGPICMHRWISMVRHVVKEEITITLRCLSANGMVSSEREEILVYLHNLYFYRFTLPAIEACCLSESEQCDPTLVRFQLLSCLLGRFLDDTIDRDSGFWSVDEAKFWVDQFTSRCESALDGLGKSSEARDAWRLSIQLASVPQEPLFRRIGKTAGVCVSDESPVPVEAYPDRVPYYFWLPRSHGTRPGGVEWLESYIQALFYWYDIEDIFSDILNNVPTHAAYQFLRATLDSEGRIKGGGGRAEMILAELKAQGVARLRRCAEDGRKRGLLLGPAMIDREVCP